MLCDWLPLLLQQRNLVKAEKSLCGDANINLSCILFVFDLMEWSLLSNALKPFKVYCAPPNFGIRT
jgi:hypothetical protein